jgi:UDP-N-acetylmuramate dehydrogenase
MTMVRADIDALAARLHERLGTRVTRNAPSAALTTYRCGGPLAVLVSAEREDDLVAVADVLAGEDPIPVVTIGRGSNLLVADEGFDGLALVLTGDFERLDVEAAAATVDAGGAVALPVLARRAANEGVSGLEFFVGIPGSVGGAVRMNAGGHGAETKEVLEQARIFDLATGTAHERDMESLVLGYRASALGSHDVVVGARLRGHRDDPDACNARIDEIVRWRREHQPGGQNAGSVFTNPPGDSAGHLIDASGLKGLRIGGAVVSHKHANFFVADPGARATDVRALVREVQAQVAARMGVHLEPELKFLGFGDQP